MKRNSTIGAAAPSASPGSGVGRFSRSKGKRGERELASELTRVLGVAARRGQQFQGSPDSPDVVTDIQNVHFECKRTERFRLYESLGQAQNDAGTEKLPVVCHRKNGKPWVVVLKLDDLPAIISTLHEHIRTRPEAEHDETTTDPTEHRPENHPNRPRHAGKEREQRGND